MTLRTFIMKRIVVSIFVLWVAATFNFVAFQGNPLAGIDEWEWAYMDTWTKEMLFQYSGVGLDPFVRYGLYLRSMFTYGFVPPYFGWSRLEKGFVAYGLSKRLPVTLFLVGTSLIGSIVVGTLIGMLAASKQGHRRDKVLTAVSLLTWSTPIFVVQFLGVFILSYLLIHHGIYVLPLNSVLPAPRPTGLALYAAIAWHMTLPIITLTLVGVGSWALYTRNMLVDALTQDYIFTARAKGLSERIVIGKHAFKTILPTVATMITLAIPTIITGSIITETIFGISGIGNYFCRAFMVEGKIVRVLDVAVIRAVFFIYATLAVFLNFVADLIYGVFDPRIRVGTRK